MVIQFDSSLMPSISDMRAQLNSYLYVTCVFYRYVQKYMKEENYLTDFSLVDYTPLIDLYDIILNNSEPHNSSTQFNVFGKRHMTKETCQSQVEKEEDFLFDGQQMMIQYSCNCTKSKCIKNYCECYRNGAQCSPNCSCTSCRNVPSKLTEAIKSTVSCNCRKSKCIKKYCECHSNGRRCGPSCQCFDCQNDKETEKQFKYGEASENDVFQ